jgi:predicted nuclease of predicted toxin-antitoxin system
LSAGKTKLRTFLDAGVPDSVGRKLEEFGHVVILHRKVLPDETPDDAVCATAMESHAILVAIDSDMKQLAKRYGVTPKSNRFDKLYIIRLCCNEVQAANRLEQALPLIEMEWKFAGGKSARRMWIDIGSHSITTHR